MAVGDRDRWNAKWADAGRGTTHGSSLVELVRPWLPDSGTLLDVAGGGSDDSWHFAQLGLAVTVVDVSNIGLAQARQRGSADELVITTVEADLELDPLPSGPFNAVTVANYLQRDLFPVMVDRLTANGVLGVVIATESNLERHEHPRREFLLAPGELPSLVPELELLHHSEAWRSNGRHEAHVVARRR